MEIVLLGAFATWRLTKLVVYEDGIFDMFVVLRSLKGLEKLTSCFMCSSVWCAGVVVLFWVTVPFMVWLLAFSALAIMLEGVAHGYSSNTTTG